MNTKQLKYLVVDDIAIVCQGIIERMQQFENWESCGYAMFVDHANQLISQHLPNLIFLDWQLKGGNAFSVLENIKSIKDYKPYIIFNTAYLSEHPMIAERVHNEYDVDKLLCITKPIFGKLFQEINQYVAEAEKKALFKIDNLNQQNEIFITTIHCTKIKKNVNELMGITHITNTKNKNLYFFSDPKIITVNWSWTACNDLLQKFQLDYFYLNQRESLIIKRYISSINYPFVFLKENPHKFKITKERVQLFEKWLRE